jgi:hypothetical protein
MWIVMTASASMPANCKGRYQRIALVKLDQYYTANQLTPKMISERALGVIGIFDMGKHHVGATPRCASAKAYAEAVKRAHELNNARDEATVIMSWGGSA